MASSRYQDVEFRVAPDVARLGVEVAIVAMGGLHNRQADPGFDAFFAQTTAAIAGRMTVESLASDPVLLGFRDLHDAIKRSNRRFVAAPENLLRMLLERALAPRVNLLVDIYNLVSMKTRLALGAHDLAHIDGNVELRLAAGGERFHPLGIPTPTSVGPGEYGYFDSAGDVLCRLEVRQSEKTKVTVGTTEAFFIVQGHRGTTPDSFRSAVDELGRLVNAYCGGTARIIRLPGV